jgi:hypothetical protein
MTQRNLSITSYIYIPILIACLYQICMSRKQIIFYFFLFCHLVSHTEPVNGVVSSVVYVSLSVLEKRERRRETAYTSCYFFLAFLFLFSLFSFSTHCLVNPSVVVVSCTIKPRRFFLVFFRSYA